MFDVKPVGHGSSLSQFFGQGVFGGIQQHKPSLPKKPPLQKSLILSVGSSLKSQLVAGLLALLLGGFGTHQFYLGNVGLGILFLLLSWTGIPAVLGLVQGILYLVASPSDFEDKYVQNKQFF